MLKAPEPVLTEEGGRRDRLGLGWGRVWTVNNQIWKLVRSEGIGSRRMEKYKGRAGRQVD